MPRRTRHLLLGVALAPLVAVAAALPAMASPAPRAATYEQLTLARAGTTAVVYVVVSNASCTSRCASVVRVSEDGDRVVRVATPATPSAEPRTDIRGLVFANARDGMAMLGGYDPTGLEFTTNGAATWRATTLHGLSILSLAATSTTYYAVATRCASTRHPCTGARLLTSSVTEPHWRTTPLADSAGIGAFGASVAAFGDHVWIDAATTRGAPRLGFSTNGGRTFTWRSEPALVAVDTCVLTATSLMSLWARCPTGMLSSDLHSANAGVGWTGLEVGLTSNTGGSMLDGVAGDLGYAATGAGTHKLDRIDGPHAAPVLTHHLPLAEPEGLAFVSLDDGYATGTETAGSSAAILARTADGGRTWQEVPLP